MWGDLPFAQEPARLIGDPGMALFTIKEPRVADGLVGKLLVAMPGIGDSRFERAVIFLCAHTHEQAMGVMVNKPREELTLADVLDHLGIPIGSSLAAMRVLDGGPVGQDRGFVLHSHEFAVAEATQPVTGAVSLTTSREVLEAMNGPTAPQQFVLALGYSGWGAGQLEQELRGNAWLVVETDEDIVFGDDHTTKWERAIRKLGIDPAHLAGETGSA